MVQTVTGNRDDRHWAGGAGAPKVGPMPDDRGSSFQRFFAGITEAPMNLESIMNTFIIQRQALRKALALAILALGGTLAAPVWAAPATATAPAQATQAKKAAVVDEDLTVVDVKPRATYLNGGVGLQSEQRMRQDARHWPLRMTFSDQPSNEFVADVKLQITDHGGHTVLHLNDAGPMTYVQLPQGDYRISAAYKGDTLTRNVHIGPKGADANFHWVI